MPQALTCCTAVMPIVANLTGLGCCRRTLLCRDAWHALQLSRDPTVLCEVVKCLPSLVAALGPAISVHELLPALAGLLQAHLSWIAGQVVPVMADLLELLPPSSQDMLLKVGRAGEQASLALCSCVYLYTGASRNGNSAQVRSQGSRWTRCVDSLTAAATCFNSEKVVGLTRRTGHELMVYAL